MASLASAPEDPFASAANGWEPVTWLLAVSARSISSEIWQAASQGPVQVDFHPGRDDQRRSYIFPLQCTARRVDDPQPGGISRIVPLTNASLVEKYRTIVSLDGVEDADVRRIEAAFGRRLSKVARPIALVYDVGQANWNSLVDGSTCPTKAPTPRIYFDFGLPLGFNRKSLPPKPLPLASAPSNVPVVLSHWDMDHYSGAAVPSSVSHSKWNSAAVSRKWIVPRQNRLLSGRNISATALALALAIHRAGNLLIFPRARKSLLLPGGHHLIQCSPRAGTVPTLNNTGLAMALNLGGDGRKDEFALLPGDADYADIASNIPGGFGAYAWIGIAGSHHGGTVPSGTSPDAAIGWHKAVFSNGRCYGHTTAQAKHLHASHGWSYQYETAARRTRLIGSKIQKIGTSSLGSHFPARAPKGTCEKCTVASECCPIK